MPIRLEKQSILLVEGKDDEGFIAAFVTFLGLAEIIQVIRMEGKDNLANCFAAIKNEPNFGIVQRLGIV